MGWNAQPTCAVIFENARVPVANRLGEEGAGFKIAMSGLDGGRINIAACSLGGAQSALDKSLAYMKERKAFGKRLDEFQALQFRLADMAIELEAARTFVWRAAAALDRKEAEATQQSLAGLEALSPTDLVDVAAVARSLGLGASEHLDGAVTPRGYRLLAKVPRLPGAVVDRLVDHFGSLQKLLSASIDDLQTVDGVGELRARSVREGLSRLAESSILERYV